MPKSVIYDLVHRVYVTSAGEEEEDAKKEEEEDEEEEDESEEEEEVADAETQEITVFFLSNHLGCC
jgi:Ran GTPase-activating protein (RanGAP) involved in mRNA processing and transport